MFLLIQYFTKYAAVWILPGKTWLNKNANQIQTTAHRCSCPERHDVRDDVFIFLSFLKHHWSSALLFQDNGRNDQWVDEYSRSSGCNRVVQGRCICRQMWKLASHWFSQLKPIRVLSKIRTVLKTCFILCDNLDE